MTLRDYQQDACTAISQAWEDSKATLLVLPTGTGKTQVFSELVRRTLPARALVIAHRDELITQAVNRIESLGIPTSREQAEEAAPLNPYTRTPVIVSTVQTQCAGMNGAGRMTRFNPLDFGLLIIDEAHHATADTYRRVIDYYTQNPNLKVLGVTATPDRADERALGQVFETVAYEYELMAPVGPCAIRDGWLVPVAQQMVEIAGLDYSHIETRAGDLNGAQLSEVMEREKNVQGIASATIQLAGDKRTLIFTASIKQAEQLADILNRHRPGMAEWICGKTPEADRKGALKRFETGETQTVVNCMVLGEGYDNPAVEVVVQGRPTKSRCLYAQQIGRGTRPLPGVVDGLPTAAERIAAISASAKPELVVLDFVGNAGRHKLVSCADILGGKYDDDVVEEAARRARAAGRPMRTDEELEKIRIELEARRAQESARKARITGRASYRVIRIDPFDAFCLAPARSRGWHEGKVLSEKQRALLQKHLGVNPDEITYAEGKALLDEQFRRWSGGLCSVKQAAWIRGARPEIDTRNLTREAASAIIDKLVGKKPRPQASSGIKQPIESRTPPAPHSEGDDSSVMDWLAEKALT